MIDAELRRLMTQEADQALDRLETDIWTAVAEQAHRRADARRLLVVQGVVLAMVLTGSVVAGKYVASGHASAVDVFSPQMPLSAVALLIGGQP